MSLVKPPYKDFIKPIAVCLPIVLGLLALFYFTQGSLFDGVLLTLLGIASTFLTMVLSVLLFKALSDVLVKNSFRILGVLVSFFATLGFISFVFLNVFKLVSKAI